MGKRSERKERGKMDDQIGSTFFDLHFLTYGRKREDSIIFPSARKLLRGKLFVVIFVKSLKN